MATTFLTVKAIARAFPGVDEGLSYGTAALKVRGKLMARLKPSIFFITEHYRDFPWVLVRLARITRSRLTEILEEAWRLVAARRLQAEYDGDRRGRSRQRPA